MTDSSAQGRGSQEDGWHCEHGPDTTSSHVGLYHSRSSCKRYPGEGLVRGTYQVLVVEEVHHAGRPIARGDQVGRCPVQTQQAQGSTLLCTIHGVSERQTQQSLDSRTARPRAMREHLLPQRNQVEVQVGRLDRQSEDALASQGNQTHATCVRSLL